MFIWHSKEIFEKDGESHREHDCSNRSVLAFTLRYEKSASKQTMLFDEYTAVIMEHILEKFAEFEHDSFLPTTKIEIPTTKTSSMLEFKEMTTPETPSKVGRNFKNAISIMHIVKSVSKWKKSKNGHPFQCHWPPT